MCIRDRVYTGTEGNPVNRRSLKRQRSIRSKETQQAPKSRRAGPSLQGIHLYMVYTGTEGNPVNRRSLKRQRSIRSKETQWKSVASGGQPTQVRIQALEPRAEQIQTVGTENVKTPISLSRF